MNPADILVIVILLLAVAVAIAIIIYRKKHGSSCCGSCADCGGCGAAHIDRNPKHYACTVRLKLGGMTCRKCAERIEAALSTMGYAKVNFSEGTGILYTNLREDEKIRQAVAEAGYVVLKIE